MRLKENILTLCDAANITVKELEIRSGLKIGTVGRWDKSVPSVDKVLKVANFFQVSIDYLVGNDTVKESAEDKFLRLYRTDTEFRNVIEKLAAAYENAAPKE